MDKASGALDADAPLFAPGLSRRKRDDGEVRLWIPTKRDVKFGYQPKMIRFSPELSEGDVAAECRALWAELQAWRESSQNGVSPRALTWLQKTPRAIPECRESDDGGAYFIQCDVDYRPVKIGFSIDPVYRLRQLATGCPFPLKMLAFHGGPRNLEQFLHHELRSARVVGEWFRPTRTVLKWAEHLPVLLIAARENIRSGRSSTPDTNADERH